MISKEKEKKKKRVAHSSNPKELASMKKTDFLSSFLLLLM